jgi:hypothetical protein
MPNNKKKILLLLVLLLSCISYAGNPDKKKISYGLTFQSHTVNQDQRTSLDLNPDGELDMANRIFTPIQIKTGTGCPDIRLYLPLHRERHIKSGLYF